MRDFSKMSQEELVWELQAIHGVLDKVIPESITFSTQQSPDDKLGQYASQAGYLEGTIRGILKTVFERKDI